LGINGLVPANTSGEGKNDPDQGRIAETAESMHRATEHLRRLWSKIHTGQDRAGEPADSASEDQHNEAAPPNDSV